MGSSRRAAAIFELTASPAAGRVWQFTFPVSKLRCRRAIHVFHDLAPGRGETILVVEDEASVGCATKRMLERHGYIVLLARNGSEALEMATTSPIDLTITDVVMPRMGGMELGRRLADCRPNMPIIYMSGYAERIIVPAGAMNVPRIFLQKPFSREALLRKTREVLDAEKQGRK